MIESELRRVSIFYNFLLNASRVKIRDDKTVNLTADEVSGCVTTAAFLALTQLEGVLKQYLGNEVFWHLHHSFHLIFHITSQGDEEGACHRCSIEIKPHHGDEKEFSSIFDDQLAKFLGDVERYVLRPLNTVVTDGATMLENQPALPQP